MSATEDLDPAETRELVASELHRLAVGDQGPAPEQWPQVLHRLTQLLHEREVRARALEDVSASSTEELTKLRKSLARQYDGIGEALRTFQEAVTVFRDVARHGDEDELNEALRHARVRFNLQLSAELFESPIPEDSPALADAASSIRVLHDNLVALSRELANLVKATSQLARSRKELELAGAVQKMLVPDDRGAEIPGARIQAWYQPAAQCSGDWWTAHKLHDGRGLVVVGDVTGSGARSAIMTGAVKGACDLARMGMRGELRPSQLMRMLNRVFHEAARGDYMMTSVALTLRPDTSQVLVCNAGHLPPWLIRAGEARTVPGAGEPPLGAKTVATYSDHELDVRTGDLIVLLTDGVTEAEDDAGRRLGERAVRSLCERFAPRGAVAVRDAVREAVTRHRGEDGKSTDDTTFVVLEVA